MKHNPSSFVIRPAAAGLRHSSFGRGAWARALILALCSLLFAPCSTLLAATREYDAEAAAVPQIDSIEFAGTWVAPESVSIKIGNSTLTVKAGADTVAVATLATAVKNAINAPTIDGSLVGAEVRNAAGQLLPEFRDVEAIIDPANTAKVLIRSKVAGVPFYDAADVAAPFTITVSETAAAGTATLASVQVATGPWHWDNATNWSANTLPINDDTVVFKNTANGPRFGLPNLVLEVTIEQHQNFTGTIGLPPINPLGYSEYRQRYARFDDAGTGTNIAHRFGLGAGPGSPLINIRHATLKCTPVVYGTGVPAAGTKALNICCTANTSELTVNKGSVDASSQDGNTAAWNIVRVGMLGGAVTDADVLLTNAMKSGGSLLQGGGSSVIGGGPAFLLTIDGGVCRIENQSTAITSIQIIGGTVNHASDATITSLTIYSTGHFNANFDTRLFVLTNCTMYDGSQFTDSFARADWGTLSVPARIQNMKLDLGVNKTLTIAP